MGTCRPAMTIQDHTWEQFKGTVDNASREVQEFMERKIEIERTEDSDLQDRKSEILERLEEIKEEQGSLQKEKNQLETELESIRLALERQEEENAMIDQALPVLTEEFQEIKRNRSISDPEKSLMSGQKFNLWLEKVELDQEELLEAVKEEVEA